MSEVNRHREARRAFTFTYLRKKIILFIQLFKTNTTLER